MDEVEVTPSPRPRRRAFQVGQVLSDTFSIWFRNLIPFFVLTVIVEIPVLVLGIAMFTGEIPEEDQLAALLGVVFGSYFFGYIATGAVTYGVFRQLSGNPAGVIDCIGVGLARLLPVVAVGIIGGLVIFAGLVAFVVPGIILACMFYVAIPVAVVEKPGIIQSLKRSAALASGQKGSIFGIALLLGFIQRVVQAIVDGATPMELWAVLLSFAVAMAFIALQSVAMGVAYYRLRESKEGVSIDELVRVFA